MRERERSESKTKGFDINYEIDLFKTLGQLGIPSPGSAR